MYVLLTNYNTYFVEYLFGELVLSNSIKEAMIFNDKSTALKFKTHLYENCDLVTSVNTFIN